MSITKRSDCYLINETIVKKCLFSFIAALLITLSPDFISLAFADEPVPVLTQPLSELGIYPESTAAAQVVSLNDAAISPQVDGLVDEVLVRVGDTVKTGAMLVKLVCKDFELERARHNAERQATLARLELAQWHLKQSELLATQRTLPMEKVQERRSELAVLRGDLAAHEARIKTTERQIAACAVKAPFAGVVTSRLVAVGQFVSRGTALVNLLDTSRSEVSAQVASIDITALNEAKTLAFEHEGKKYPLKLHAVVPTIQTQTGTQEVRLDFIGPPSQPGSAGRLVWQNPNLHIASDLLVKRGEQLGVFTLQGSLAHFHPLPGATNGRPASIGLSPDTQIIVSGQYSLNEGAAVKVQSLNKDIRRESSATDLSRPSTSAKKH
ncbi:efflux RND transporter periplasmic adaptor subunit [Methyloglobulus sp.]|uniref:efflux RND transporter periplasmic adaptor subunit n=1 Tax=Methyloglobulus sp. TaxID=2518622 RepID=UPI001803B1E1|nr:efflux RND transporter periplasmic adaptor subunit [Methyloglobulus sp.]